MGVVVSAVRFFFVGRVLATYEPGCNDESLASKNGKRHTITEKKGRFYRDLNPDYQDQNLGC